MKKILLFSILLVTLIVPSITLGRIGVGVATGKITVDQPLKAGMVYSLPPLTVLNTGDEPSEYGVKITQRENQPELKVPTEWISFEPSTFTLKPTAAQTVRIKLTLPVKGAVPGDYFAFLQAHPNVTKTQGGTSIGIAAAAKLYFSVRPTNMFVGIYYRATSLYSLYYPWSLIIILVILGAVVIAVMRRYFSFNIGVNVRRK